MTTTDTLAPVDAEAPGQRIAKKASKRLFLGQTAIDFWGRRMWGFGVSLLLIVISVISLSTRWLNLGIEFEGGISFDVPAAEGFDTDAARGLLSDNGVNGSDAKVEERRSSSGEIVKIQIEDVDPDVRDAVQVALAERVGVDAEDVSVSAVSASWGDEITRKAIIALVVFIALIFVVISIRFEWRMAVSAILAMLHDIVIAAGIYSVFGFEVTPATVTAFLTILGYSLYDTVVVFDRIKENERRIAAAGLNGADLVNISTNQVLLRSLNTSVSALLPVVSLLVIGSGLLGQVTLREFGIALFIGMVTGAYSSIYIATPILGWLKGANGARNGEPDWLVGEELRHIVVRGVGVLAPKTGRRRGSRGTGSSAGERRRAAGSAAVDEGEFDEAAQSAVRSPKRAPVEATTEQLLSHPPRARKKKRH